MARSLTIIRGASGSGKTTLAKFLMAENENAVNVEADMYFSVHGEYKFDPTKLAEAHAWCLSEATLFLCEGKDVIVSNTFTRAWEYAPYLKLALENGLRPVIYECSGEYQNIHGVPEEKVILMRQRFEPHTDDNADVIRL